MRLPSGIRRLFRVGAWRAEVERDLADELDHHFECAVAELVRDGMSEREAVERARERFGDVRAYRDALRRIDGGRVRMRDRVELLDVVVRNVAFALRSMRRSPGLTLSVMMILALGIGSNVVMFGVVDRLLLSPPQHVRDADQVRHVYVRRTIFNGTRPTSRTLTFPDYQDLRSVNAFGAVGAYASGQRKTLGQGAEAEQVLVTGASSSLFPLLGVAPAMGRFFTPDDDALDAHAVAVLSHEYWDRRFAGDPAVLGTSLDIGLGTYEVVGIAPAGFTGAELDPVDVWVPLMRSEQIESGARWVDNRNWWWLHVVTRLRPGVSDEAATAQATAAHRGGRAEAIEQGDYDERAELLTASVIAARGPDPSAEARVAAWLAGVSLIVLLIACFNVANLLLARGTRIARELAVRTALGVSRGRLLGQLLTESLLLSGLGAGAALVVSSIGGRAVHQVLLPNVAFADTLVSGRLLVFLAVATLLTALLAGLVPAYRASRCEVADALRTGGGGGDTRGGARLRASLLIGQATLSAVLLVGAGLFVLSLRRAEATDFGYDPERVLVVRPHWTGSPAGENRLAILRDAVGRVRALPRVEGAATTYTIPFWSSIGIGQPRVPGLDSIPRHQRGGPYVNKAGPGYFEAMGLEILRGRAFTEADDADDAPPVAILTESMARAIWPAGDALGQCMIFGDEEDDPPCTTVVGVVENFRRQELVEPDPHFQYFVNQAHPEFVGPPQALMVRTAGQASEETQAVRAAFRATSPLIRFADVRPLADNIAPHLRSWRLGATMFTVFGLLALVVAGWGLYSVLAFDVALRHHELGVRAALGAGVPRMVRLVLRRALAVVAVGVLAGLVVGLGAGRLVEPLLFEVSPTDPRVYAVVAVTLLGVAGLAGTLPAWRATRVQPTEALRVD